MYPNLRYAFYDIFGLDLPFLGLVQSFGFLMAMAFLFAGWVLSRELKYRHSKGLIPTYKQKITVGTPFGAFEGISSALIGFLIGFKGLYVAANSELFASNEAKSYLFSLEHGYWLWGIVFAIAWPAYRFWERKKEREQYPKEQEIEQEILPQHQVGDIVVVSAISGVLGAKLLYLIEYYDPNAGFFEQLFNGSGLVIYGGLITAFVVVTLFARGRSLPFVHLIDSAAPALIIAYGIGRLGCHFSGDGDWGDPNPWASSKPSFLPDWLWAYSYPNNVINEGIPLETCGYPESFGNYCMVLAEPVFPTPIYEFILTVFIFAFLIFLRNRITTPGLLFSIYLIFNGLERFTIEIIRINDEYSLFGISLSQAQVIASILFFIGLISSLILLKKGREQKNN